MAAAEGVRGTGLVFADDLSIGGEPRAAGLAPAGRAHVTDAEFAASGNAGRLVVNWTRTDRTSVASPANAEGLLGIADAPRSGGEVDHGTATWSLRPSGAWREFGWQGPSWAAASRSDGGISLRPSEPTTWSVGARPETEVGGYVAGLYSNISVASDLVIVGETDTTLTLQGQGEVYLWGFNLTILDEQGNQHEYRSGQWSDNETGPSGFVRTLHAQFLRLRIDGGEAQFVLPRDLVEWATPSAHVEAGRVAGAHVTGNLSALSQTARLQDQALEIEGRAAMDVAAEAKRLVAGIAFQGAATSEGKRLFDTSSSMITRLQPLAPPLAAGAVALVAVGIVWLALGRARRPRDLWLTAAERALSRRHPLTAQREARGLLRARPDDADAWFVYATGLLQSNEHDRLVREVEPVAHRLASDRTRGLAFVLALAHARMSAPERAAPWLALASEDPDLRRRASLEPALRSVLDLSAAS